MIPTSGTLCAAAARIGGRMPRSTTRHGLRALGRLSAEGMVAMGLVGGGVVALLVGQQGKRGGQVEAGQWQQRAQQLVHLRQAGEPQGGGRE